VANSSAAGPRSAEKLRGCPKQGTAAMQAAVLMENFSTHADDPRQRPATPPIDLRDRGSRPHPSTISMLWHSMVNLPPGESIRLEA
jgi:hypothetical protein